MPFEFECERYIICGGFTYGGGRDRLCPKCRAEDEQRKREKQRDEAIAKQLARLEKKPRDPKRWEQE